MNAVSPRICFIGFGEAGQAIAEGLREQGVARISAWDILFPETGRCKAETGGRSRRCAHGRLGG